MSFAPLLRSRAIAPAAAVFAATTVALYPRNTAFAEEADLSLSRRKPIYDDDEPSIQAASEAASPIFSSQTTTMTRPQRTSGPSPTDRLAAQIGKTRMFLYAHVSAVETKINNTMTKALDLENTFTSTIASLAPPKESGEKLMPGSIYVLVSAMTGSIITRNRNVLLRTSVPALIGIGAGWVVLPITMTNISNLLWKYEQKFPVIADTHLRARNGIERAIYMAKLHTEQGKRIVEEKVADGRESVEGWVRKGK